MNTKISRRQTNNGKVNYLASRKRAPSESERIEKALKKIGRRMNLRPGEESTGELICNPSTIILPLQHLRPSTGKSLWRRFRAAAATAAAKPRYSRLVEFRSVNATQRENATERFVGKIDWGRTAGRCG